MALEIGQERAEPEEMGEWGNKNGGDSGDACHWAVTDNEMNKATADWYCLLRALC